MMSRWRFDMRTLKCLCVSSHPCVMRLSDCCGDAMLHATTRCMSSSNIVERIYEDEIHKRIYYLLHERTDMQMECSVDAIRIEWIHVEINVFLCKQLDNQNSFGELL